MKNTTQVATASVLGSVSVPRVHAAEDNTIRVALVGCGGRGTGAAANALATSSGPTRLVAMADVFDYRLQTSLKTLTDEYGTQVDVPAERQFVGFEGYRAAIECLKSTDLVILATPPAFRPLHLEFAVEKGCNVFMEKSFAVDAPGIRRVLKAGKEASRKNLKIAGGLMSRHYPPLQAAVQKIHDGAIGEVITCWAYREHEPVGFASKRAGMTEMAHQIRNYSNFTWLNGSFILDWLIHNLDVCCWVKGAWPVSAQGQGGRQVRQEPDQLFDHYAVEYRFEDGTRMFAQGRHMASCWSFFGDVIQGATGCAVLGEGIREPKIYRGHLESSANLIWEHRGEFANAYQVEHDRLFEAIRNDLPYNETERSAYAALTGILGRMAAESGQEVSWETALASEVDLAPGIEGFTMETEPPVFPDAEGSYPVAMPGVSRRV
ncbi:MAG: Gfo/Idh/MocA family oxidoreductase [Acidobacteriota bacterium]|nr:MAG: Gfo/Idh/MocA family oxidoreductase [Acidobacteriota bacterium]